MREPDMARRCVSALAGVALLVGGVVLATWWLPVPDSGAGGRPLDPLRVSPARSASLPGVPSAAIPIASVSPNSSEPAPGRTLREDPERQLFRLEMENARLRSRLDDMLNWILDNVRGTFPLPEGQMAHLRLEPVGEDMGVSADLAQLLRLDDHEIQRLDAAFVGTRSVLLDLEEENIHVETPGDHQVLLSIPPYSEEGQLVRDALYEELVQTLGRARFDRFLQVAEEGLERQFEYFGEVDRTLLFEAVRDAVSGAAQLFVRDERVVPSRLDPMRQDIIASERIVSELPEEYYPYWNWLPESITGFSRSN